MSKILRRNFGPTASHDRLVWLFLFAVLLAIAVAAGSSIAIAQEGGALAAGDQVRVTVFGEEDLSGEFEVDAAGQISLPLIGKVAAAGGGADELEASIVTALLDGYLKHPRVSVEILSFRSIFVMGEVNRPGSYPYSTGLTAIKAIALAGGFTYRAKKNVLFITRDPELGEQEIRVDNFVLPGDTIRVKERFF